MIVLEYELTPLSRVSAGRSGQVQNVRNIHEILPGTVVRGALGTAWWSDPQSRYQGPDSQGDFDDLFGRRMEVRQAVPVRDVGVGTPTTTPEYAALRPVSWVTCKYPEAGCFTGWHDLAAVIDECPDCGGSLESARGWVIPPGWSVGTVRTALKNGAAKDDQLYTRRAMRTTVRFVGTLILRDGPALTDQIAWLTTPREISVGGQLSTMGRCRWTCSVVQSDAPTDLTTGAVVLRLLSPAILVNTYGGPTLDLGGAVMDAAQRNGGSATVRRVWRRPTEVSGWNGIAGLPKPEEWAVAAGSTALISDLDSAAAAVLARGIGLRRLEGYGETMLLPVSQIQTRHQDEPPEWTTPGWGRTFAARPAEHVPLRTLTTSPAPQPPAEASAVSSPEPSETKPDPVEVALARITDADQRAATLKGVLAQAGMVRRLRENRFPESIIEGRIDELVSLPWMSQLAGPIRDELTRLLKSPDLADHVRSMQRLQGEQP